ncbi:MAG: GNAT family N-acetyltransferase [Frankiaceae bacterium]|nr:GNAT family N-acetyltransferase [Frankiaceae bacterium]MBV9871223.1 GNAT family N-acetyltransferase [Frankiaceae bacterium]
MGELAVAADSPSRADVMALLERHLEFAYANSPHADVHALDATRLTADGISFFSVRDDGELLGVGAIKELDPTHGELKSMHTAIAARGRGVGRLMVNHLLSVAAARGYTRVSLETGVGDAFAPALGLYDSIGFVRCEPFADYVPSEHSTFMTMELTT